MPIRSTITSSASSIEEDQKRENILGENPKNELLLLTDTYYPRLLIGRQEKGGELRTTEIDVEEFALVKSIRARGKRIAPYLIDQVEELPPLKESPVFERSTTSPWRRLRKKKPTSSLDRPKDTLERISPHYE